MLNEQGVVVSEHTSTSSFISTDKKNGGKKFPTRGKTVLEVKGVELHQSDEKQYNVENL